MNSLGEAALFPKINFPQEEPEPQSCCGMAAVWPKQTFLVFIVQAIEQFVFVGVQLLLIFYMVQTIGMDPLSATLYFQVFMLISIIFTLIGSILADGFLGKFATIFYLNIICIVGLVILTVSSIFPMGAKYHPYLDFFGIFLWAAGIGGLRPCISVFGADQYKAYYVSMISTYFALFYMITEVGSALSQIYLPIFKVIPCMQQNTCYPMAFGLCALLMFFSLLIFSAGICVYRPVVLVENPILRALDAIKIALYCKFKGIGPARDEWIDYYLNAHDCTKSLDCIQASRGRPAGAMPNCPHAKFLDEVKAIFRLIVMFFPVPFFWALYQQQNTLWMTQASQMDIHLTPTIMLPPDHMFLVALALLLVMIPLFQCFIYPLFGFCGLRITYLRRMVIGGIFAVLAFAFSAVIQSGVNQTMPAPPGYDSSILSVINIFPPGCKAIVADVPGYVTAAIIPGGKSLVDNPLTAQKEAYRVASGRINPGIQLNGSCAGHNFIRQPMTVDPYSMQYIVVGAQGIFSNKVDFEKPKEGNGLSSLSINFAIPCKFVPDSVRSWGSCAGLSDEIAALQTYSGSLAVCRQTPNVTVGQVCNPMDPTGFYEWPANSWSIHLLRAFPPQGQDNPQGRAHFTYYPPTGRIGPGPFALYYVNHTAAITNGQVSTNYEPVSSATFQIQGFGGAYTLIVGITDSVLSDKADNIAMLHQLLPPGFLSLSWQLPQYILITFTKLMFCITGMEFAYTQAPPSMKTFVQALWLFHLGGGEFLAFLLSTIGVVNLTIGLVLCTIGLFTVVLIFAFMAIYNYRYVHFSTIDDDRQQLLKEDLGLGDDTLHKRQNSTSGANTFVTRL